MATLFQKMFTGEFPVEHLYRNDKHGILVFPDAFPSSYGHFLVIPREPVDHWHDLDPSRIAQLTSLASLVGAHAMERLTNPKPERIGQIVSGYGVPHAHLHGLPSYSRGDLANLFNPERATPPNKISDEMLERTLADLALTPELVERADRLLDKYAEPVLVPDGC